MNSQNRTIAGIAFAGGALLMTYELGRQMFGFGWSVALAAAVFMTLSVLAIARAANGHPLAAAIPSGVMALGTLILWALLPDFAYTLPGSFAAFIVSTRFALYDLPGVKEAHERSYPDMEENLRMLNLTHGNDVIDGPYPTDKPTHQYEYKPPPC